MTAGIGAECATQGTTACTTEITTGWHAEAERQNRLLALLWGKAGAVDMDFTGTVAARQRGLAAYRANAAALAPRALAGAYPTVALLLGAAPFAALARAFWHRHPPQRGDIACWGAGLPPAIQQDPQLIGEPYLADVARLDWAVHGAAAAADDIGPPVGLDLLASADPALLQLRLRTGSAVVVSPYPIVEIWRAHHGPPSGGPGPQPPEAGDAGGGGGGGGGGGRFDAAREALREGKAQAAWVTRTGGCRVEVLALDEAGARFTQALLDGACLEASLLQAGPAFNFEAWLILALRHHALAEVQVQVQVQGAGYSSDSGTNGRSSLNFMRSQKVESGSSVSTTSRSSS